MILIESSSGDNGIFVAFRLASGSDERYANLPGGLQGLGAVRYITVSKPFACAMPPPGGSGLWYPVDASPFGPACQQMEVGTLSSIKSYPYEPKPCFHSTMSGTMSYSGSGEVIPNSFRRMQTNPSPNNYFYPNGSKILLTAGSPFYPNIKGYNRFGELVDGTITSEASAFWATTYITDPLTSVSPRLGRYATPSSPSVKDDMVWYYHYDPLFKAVNWNTYRTVDHTGRLSWSETWITELHHDFGGILASDRSVYSGAPYCYASVRRERTYTMTHIQSTSPTVFTGRFAVTERVHWRYTDPSLYNHVLTEGVETYDYVIDSPLLSMKPGSSKGSIPPRETFDAFCADALPSVLEQYQDDKIAAARGIAYQDTAGLQANWLENLGSLGGIASVLVPLTEGYRAVRTRDPIAAKNALRDAFLSYLYIIRPTVTDIAEVGNKSGIIKQARSLVRYSERRRGAVHDQEDGYFIIPQDGIGYERPVLHDFFCTLHLKPRGNPLAKVWGALESLGLSPDLGNDWDMIPFSFVADWFVSVGDALKELSAWSNAVVSCDMSARIETAKTTMHCIEQDLARLDLTGCKILTPLDYVQYDRRVLSGYGEVSPSFFDTTTGLTPSQLAQGVALLS